MRKKVHPWIGLLVLCLLLVGCGGEEREITVDNAPAEPDKIPMRTEVIVEPSEPTIFIDGQSRQSVGLVRELLADESIEYPLTAVLVPDDTYEPQTSVRFLVKIGTVNGRLSNETIKVLADQTFGVLKIAFEARAKKALADELAYRQMAAETAGKEIKQLQQSLQTFQEAQRGLPQTDASRLERRKLERKIETTLQSQIDANKLVESLQRKIDREQFVTLVRVR